MRWLFSSSLIPLLRENSLNIIWAQYPCPFTGFSRMLCYHRCVIVWEYSCDKTKRVCTTAPFPSHAVLYAFSPSHGRKDVPYMMKERESNIHFSFPFLPYTEIPCDIFFCVGDCRRFKGSFLRTSSHSCICSCILYGIFWKYCIEEEQFSCLVTPPKL